jgi:hypothetical protein
MPLQNRVDPFGDIHAIDARGLFTGNRGVIHDPATKTLLSRRWTTKAWIICECEFRGRRREVMGHNAPSGNAGWTELFFLDEVTALAAGHRPCFYCRRSRAKEFAGHFGDAFGIADPKAGEIDERLHRERFASALAATDHFRPPDLDREAIDALPDGAMLCQGDRTFAKHGRNLRAWTFWGWADEWEYSDLAIYDIWLLTPPTTVEILRQGYKPVWHPTIKTLPRVRGFLAK